MTIRGGIGLFSFPPGQVGYAVFLYGKSLTDTGTGQSIFRPGFAFKYPADGGPPELVPLTDELLAEILKNFNTETGLGGEIPDEDLANFENQLGDPEFQQEIADLRDQIEGLGKPDNPIFDATQRVIPVIISTPYNPNGS
jgi:hypothetical protein